MHIFYNLNSETAAGEDVCFCSYQSHNRQIGPRIFSIVLKCLKVIVWPLHIDLAGTQELGLSSAAAAYISSL